MCVPYWWCTKQAQLIMGTWPIYKKHFLQLILTKKTFHLIKYLLATFIFFPFFSICTCSILVQAKALCCQTTSHYMSQCVLRHHMMSPGHNEWKICLEHFCQITGISTWPCFMIILGIYLVATHIYKSLVTSHDILFYWFVWVKFTSIFFIHMEAGAQAFSLKNCRFFNIDPHCVYVCEYQVCPQTGVNMQGADSI